MKRLKHNPAEMFLNAAEGALTALSGPMAKIRTYCDGGSGQYAVTVREVRELLGALQISVALLDRANFYATLHSKDPGDTFYVDIEAEKRS